MNETRAAIIEVFIPLQPPSQNQFGRHRKGRGAWKYYQAKDSWTKWIPPLVLSRRPRVPVRLIVTRIMPFGKGVRKYDNANLRGGLKPIIDAFKDAGYMVDDGDDWLTAEYRQVRPTPPPAMIQTPGTLFQFIPMWAKPEYVPRGTRGKRNAP